MARGLQYSVQQGPSASASCVVDIRGLGGGCLAYAYWRRGSNLNADLSAEVCQVDHIEHVLEAFGLTLYEQEDTIHGL